RLYPLQRVVLALDRDQHLLRRDERVDRQQAERRRAVDEDVVVLHGTRLDRAGQPGLPGHHGDQLDLRTGEVDRRRYAGEVRDAVDRLGDIDERRALDEAVVDVGYPRVVR